MHHEVQFNQYLDMIDMYSGSQTSNNGLKKDRFSFDYSYMYVENEHYQR